MDEHAFPQTGFAVFVSIVGGGSVESVMGARLSQTEPLMLLEADIMFGKIHISMSLYRLRFCIIRRVIGNIIQSCRNSRKLAG